jgi:hypothetical protein
MSVTTAGVAPGAWRRASDAILEDTTNRKIITGYTIG